jgi:hypothetical protein
MLAIVMLLLLLPVPILIHLLHLHKKTAFTAARRRNLDGINRLHITLLVMQQLRWRGK